MDKTNSKVLTVSFAMFGALIGFTFDKLMVTFASAFGVIAQISNTDFVQHFLPVIVGVLVFCVLQFNKRVLAWGDDVVSEIRKIVWPSRKDTWAMTIVVCVMVMISSLIVTSFDFVSAYLLKLMIQ